MRIIEYLTTTYLHMGVIRKQCKRFVYAYAVVIHIRYLLSRVQSKIDRHKKNGRRRYLSTYIYSVVAHLHIANYSKESRLLEKETPLELGRPLKLNNAVCLEMIFIYLNVHFIRLQT